MTPDERETLKEEIKKELLEELNKELNKEEVADFVIKKLEKLISMNSRKSVYTDALLNFSK